MLRRLILTSISVILVAVTMLHGNSAAATTPVKITGTGIGLRISPVRTDLTIAPGTSQTVDVYVDNLTSQPTVLQGVVNDFVAGDETGTPYILLNGEKAPSHGLLGFTSSIGNFSVGSGVIKDLKVKITIPKGTAGGGYYGVVRVLPASENASKNVSLSASVGSLILVTVPGNIINQVSIASLDVRPIDKKTGVEGNPSTFFTTNKSLDAVVRFQNTGNEQEEPFGKIILERNNVPIGTYPINATEPPSNVLPNSIRRFSVPLTGLGSYGKYTLEGNFGYSTTGQLISATYTFYIVPVFLLTIIGCVILVVLFLVFILPRMVRSYNRRVLRKAGRRHY
jgi:hypothetical protein